MYLTGLGFHMPEINDFFSDENYSGLILIASDFQFPLLFDRVLSIGRNRGENIIIIRHKSVSRQHAKISFDGKSFRIDDVKSTNGTIINGQKVQSAILKSGDEVKIGEAVLQLKGELKNPPAILDDAYEDPGMTQILDLDFEKLKINAKTDKDLKLVEKIKQKISVERKQLQDLAFKDGLTNVFNRRFFDIELKRSLNIARRHQRKVSLMLIDIDHFKKFNDLYGHQVGDDVLKWVASAIGSLIRDTDIVARYGGEELAVILVESDSVAANIVAEKICSVIQKRSATSFPSEITVSIGIAEFPLDGLDSESIISAADIALYESKDSGRNRVTNYTSNKLT